MADNIDEFTNKLIGLISDARSLETKINNLKGDIDQAAKATFDRLNWNAARIESNLNELFKLTKKNKNGKK